MEALSENGGLRVNAKSIGCYAPGAALAVAALALYLPIYLNFAQGAWRQDENAHTLIIMAIAAGAAGVRLATEKFDWNASRAEQIAGFAILLVGLALIGVGSASETDLFLSASQGVSALGAVLFFFGGRGVRRLWFPLALTLYLIIWPGWAIDALTAPLKIFVSKIVAEGFCAAGLPVAHAGAIISAGPYQLLVAAACAGLNSLIALTSIGAVYLYVVKHADWRINAIVLASLIPIAIAANILRVAALTLITLYLGYDAGQGFMHEGAGLLMFAVALALVFVVDAGAIAIFSKGARK
jgi:exosortase